MVPRVSAINRAERGQVLPKRDGRFSFALCDIVTEIHRGYRPITKTKQRTIRCPSDFVFQPALPLLSC